MCDTVTNEAPVYAASSEISSKDDVLSSLKVGAFPLEMFDSGTYTSLGDCGVDGLEVFASSISGGSCSDLKVDTIFKGTDVYGIEKLLKNVVSTVEIPGVAGTPSFRTPVSFISLVDPELRDMYNEVDGVIKHLFQHPSHPPFLATRMMQRFGISNPSPGFIKRVVGAYRSGLYTAGAKQIGDGTYGNMASL